jgi:hypothetical protein
MSIQTIYKTIALDAIEVIQERKKEAKIAPYHALKHEVTSLVEERLKKRLKV